MAKKNKKELTKWQRVKKILFNLIPVFIIAGGIFYYFFPAEYWLAKHIKDNTPIERIATKTNEDTSDTQPTEEEPPSYGNDNQLEATAGNLLQASQIDYIASGGIFIPKAGIRLPIYRGIGNYTMLKGAGEQYDNSVVTAGSKGNYVLASHRTPYDGYLFTNLHVIGQGDEFYVVGSDTNMIYQYKVDWTSVVSPNEDDAIQQDQANSTSETTENTKSVSLDGVTGFAKKEVGAVSVSTKKDLDYNTGKETTVNTQQTITAIDESTKTATITEKITTTTNEYLSTLYTCTDNYATNRLVVRSHLSAVITVDEAPQELKDAYSGWFSGRY